MNELQFLQAMKGEFSRLADNGEAVDPKTWTAKIESFLKYLKLQASIDEQAKQIEELKTGFAIPKFTQTALIDGAGEPEVKVKRAYKKRIKPTEQAQQAELPELQ